MFDSVDTATISYYSLRVFKVFAIFFLGRWVVNYCAHKIKQYLSHIYHDELRLTLLTNAFVYVGYFVLIAALLYEFGFNITALIGAAGVIGVAIGYASKTSVANIISGMFLMIEQPFKLGDTLIVDNIEGVVTGVNLFAITIKTDDKIVRIPHEKLLKNSIIKKK